MEIRSISSANMKSPDDAIVVPKLTPMENAGKGVAEFNDKKLNRIIWRNGKMMNRRGDTKSIIQK